MPNEADRRIDIMRIVASLFWIGGAILTLIVAIEVYQQNEIARQSTENPIP